MTPENNKPTKTIKTNIDQEIAAARAAHIMNRDGWEVPAL